MFNFKEKEKEDEEEENLIDLMLFLCVGGD